MTEGSSHISAPNASWSFDGIAEDCDKHFEKSIPHYHEGHDLILSLSDFFLSPDATAIELGCSTGTLARRLLDRHKARDDIRYVGIDCVADMIERARTVCADDTRVQFEQDDIVTRPFESSSLIISYYTVQFVHPKHRQDVFNKIYDALEWGGALILFEKVRAPDARFQDIATQIYQDFKLENDFTEAEIVNKSRSLKGILEPFSTQGNLDLMQRAGFVDIMTISKWVCFEGFVAIK